VTVLTDAGAKLAPVLAGARGPLCFQAILASDDNAAIFELNARIGHGYPLSHRAGAEFTRWLLEEALDISPTVSDSWCEGVSMLRYDAAVFVTDERSISISQ
jgi:carbamoyl-phosphate synthase large subunit